MKDRPLKELCQLLLDTFDKPEYNYSFGLCVRIAHLATVTSEKELFTLHSYILDNKPTWYKNIKFYYKKGFSKKEHPYWWTRDKAGNKQRKLFVEHLIKKLK